MPTPKAPPPPPAPPLPPMGQPLPQAPPPQTQVRPSFVPVMLDARTPPVNLPQGVGPKLVNWQISSAGMTPRLGYAAVNGASAISSSASLFHGDTPTIMGELVDTVLPRNTYAFSASSGTLLWWTATPSRWSQSNFSSVISNDPMGGPPTDWVQVYDDVATRNAIIFVTGKNSPYIAGGPPNSDWTYSTVTGAPPYPVTVCYYDDRVVFANMQFVGNRVAWSGRGSIYTYTAPDGGVEDLVDFKGPILKTITDGDRIVLLGQREIWAGYPADFPFGLRFAPLDRSMGCSDPRTAVNTPAGVMFQGSDYNVWLLPTNASKAVPVGYPVWPDLITQSGTAFPGDATARTGFAVYDSRLAEYQLYPNKFTSSGSFSQTAFCFNLVDKAWSERSFAHKFAAGAMIASGDLVGSPPATWFAESGGTIDRAAFAYPASLASVSTTDRGSTYSALAAFPIGNPDPTKKLFVRDVVLDYSNVSAPSGSSITIALSPDFGQTYDKQIGVALPFTQYSRQTLINVAYSAIYPTVELRYESQVSGNFLNIHRATAVVQDVGQPGVGGG